MLKQIKRQRKIKHREYSPLRIALDISLFSLIVITLLLFVGREAKWTSYLRILIFPLLIIFGQRWAKTIYSYCYKTFKVYNYKDIITNDLIFDNDFIQFEKDSEKIDIPRANITALNLVFNLYKYCKNENGVPYNGLASLEIEDKEGKKYEFKFVINNEEELNKLKTIWKTYYQAGIKVKEQLSNGIKTFMLDEKILTYKEIQAYKKELGIENFY